MNFTVVPFADQVTFACCQLRFDLQDYSLVKSQNLNAGKAKHLDTIPLNS